MGKYKFRLSDMIPNAWFYKLKYMNSNRSKHNSSQSQSTTKKKLKSTTISPQKSHFSYPLYFSTNCNSDATKLHGFYSSPFNQKEFKSPHFPEPARKSSKRRSRRKTIYKPSPRVVVNPVSAACNCHLSLNSVGSMPDPICSPDSSFSSTEYSPRTEVHEYSPSEADEAITVSSDSFDDLASWSSSCKCTMRSSNNDIIIDMKGEMLGRKTDWSREVDRLPPVSRKPMTPNKKASEANNLRRSFKSKEIKANQSFFVKVEEDESIRNVEKPRTSSAIRKSSASPIGVKLRANSPRMGRRKNQAHARRNVPSSNRLKPKNSCLIESFAMVKASHNPQQDFRESMVEMIVENNIRTSEDLEELLACYLILNSDEYHDLIIKTFEQIWFDMAELRI